MKSADGILGAGDWMRCPFEFAPAGASGPGSSGGGYVARSAGFAGGVIGENSGATGDGGRRSEYGLFWKDAGGTIGGGLGCAVD